jgi:mono/diheme cytochrome c family protein
MSRTSLVILSVVAALVVLIVIGTLIAFTGVYNVAADVPDSGLVRFIVGHTREASIEGRAEGIKVPSLDKPDMIAEGAEHYDAMCTGCHLAPGMKENEMRPGMNPKPPILANFPADDPAEVFWIVKHGIKMSGMPAWGKTHSDEEIWNIVAFLQKLPKLSPQQYRALVTQSHHRHDGMGG